MFHDVTGSNVILNEVKNEASWAPRQSGGMAFTDRPLSPKAKVTVTFIGSGAAELGVTTTNPASFTGAVPDAATRTRDYVLLNDIKMHKRTCNIEVTLDENSKVKKHLIQLLSSSSSSSSPSSHHHHYIHT